MLTVPSVIEDLIKKDGVRKNFRVHFPNGERADLTNSDIVAESVSFSESVCSDSSFRFGSADASQISFETVGVENIIGLTIECSMEYEVPVALQSLYGAWYGIPYGVFVVDSCPRDHSAMTHRKVTAYSRRFTNAFLPPLELWKMSRRAEKNFYNMNPYYFLAEMGITHPGTEAAVSGTTGTSAYLAYSNIEDGQTAVGRYYGYYPANQYLEYTITDFDCIYRIDMTGSLDDLYDILDQHNVQRSSKIVTATLEISNTSPVKSDKFHVPLHDNGDGTISANLIYPDCPQIAASDTVKIYIPLSIEARYANTENPSLNWQDTAVVATACTLTKVTATGVETGMKLAFESTLEDSTGYTFYNAFSLGSIVTGYAELTAGMVRTNRDGTVELVYLDNSSPYALDASDVMGSAWWDEYDVGAIGTVRYDFTDKNGQQQTGEYVMSDSDVSVYDMTGNYLLNNLKGATASYIEGTLLKQLFKPRSGTAVFTPLDADFRGMPFLQAGDAIELTAYDGTVVESYILSQTFDGIQLITQDIDTVQGEVLNNEY